MKYNYKFVDHFKKFNFLSILLVLISLVFIIFKSLNYNIDPKKFKNAEIIHEQGFFIGLPSIYMSDEKVSYLVNILLN